MQTVHNLIILDASGSMGSIYSQALTGLNETIQSIKIAQRENPEIRQVITLASFSSGTNYLREIFKNIPAEDVRELTEEDYTPYGGTALYDAIGEMTYQVKGLMEKNTRALVTIITDGEENSSHRFDGKQIKSLIEELRLSNWMFTYIGANQDVILEAAKMGIRSSMSFCANDNGTKAMFAKERRSRGKFFKKLVDNFAITSLECEDSYFDDEDIK